MPANASLVGANMVIGPSTTVSLGVAGGREDLDQRAEPRVGLQRLEHRGCRQVGRGHRRHRGGRHGGLAGGTVVAGGSVVAGGAVVDGGVPTWMPCSYAACKRGRVDDAGLGHAELALQRLHRVDRFLRVDAVDRAGVEAEIGEQLLEARSPSR